MRSERAAVALLLPIIAVAAFGQEATPSSEFGRGSGGQIELLTKRSSRLSGSLGVSFGQSRSPFASGGTKGYEATFGGTLAEDHIWFFGSMLRDQSLPFASSPRAISTPVATPATTSANFGKVDAQIGDRNSLAALFANGTAPANLSLGDTSGSFLSLHYTGIVSSNMFFTASVVRSSVDAQPALPSF